MENPYLLELSWYLRGAYPSFVLHPDPPPIKDYIPVFIFHKVEREGFEEKLKFLRDNFYNTITCDELYNFIQGKHSFSSPTVCLTFDDVHKSLYEIAYPLLKEYGFCAVAFVVPLFIGKEGWITWEGIDEMSRSGIIDFQSHTLNHRRMWGFSEEQSQTILSELKESRRILEERLNKPVRHLAYPYGRGSRLAQILSREAGFLTNFWGPLNGHPYNTKGTDPYKLARLKDDYIFRLPGKGRKSIREIFALKLKRRKEAKKLGIDIYS